MSAVLNLDESLNILEHLKNRPVEEDENAKRYRTELTGGWAYILERDWEYSSVEFSHYYREIVRKMRAEETRIYGSSKKRSLSPE